MCWRFKCKCPRAPAPKIPLQVLGPASHGPLPVSTTPRSPARSLPFKDAQSKWGEHLDPPPRWRRCIAKGVRPVQTPPSRGHGCSVGDLCEQQMGTLRKLRSAGRTAVSARPLVVKFTCACLGPQTPHLFPPGRPLSNPRLEAAPLVAKTAGPLVQGRSLCHTVDVRSSVREQK